MCVRSLWIVLSLLVLPLSWVREEEHKSAEKCVASIPSSYFVATFGLNK